MTNSSQQHPIESLLKAAMENIKEMIDVNTVVGNPVENSEGIMILPITKATFGFAAGGAEYGKLKENTSEDESKASSKRYPFGGGSGAGISIQPVAFMVVEKNHVQIMHIHHNFGTISKILEEGPNFLTKLENCLNLRNKKKIKAEEGTKEKGGRVISKIVEIEET
ncbi:MAG TPA: GerW family sporulation protein [Defluviitaleaceae bacterium]|nr:sporulation protein YtfJ [Candidatus Epulonipiscium sp.]HOQ16168.1 GerW family sporulation protein [Defluviitaleaceae bacterium]HPT76185.1 GerW family sporulation protein [Defluviitaleaceae bacterium]HQD51126.1 GerW family sporulation protein [Defluviitaleaceae bacterium]